MVKRSQRKIRHSKKRMKIVQKSPPQNRPLVTALSGRCLFGIFGAFSKIGPISRENTRKIEVSEKLGRWLKRRFWGRRAAGGIWTQDPGNLVPEMAVLGSTYFAIDSPSWNAPFCSGKSFGDQIPTSKGPNSPPTASTYIYITLTKWCKSLQNLLGNPVKVTCLPSKNAPK